MRTNIQGSRTWWKRCAVLFASQLIILLLIIVTGRLAYVMNDDTTMIAIVSGGYGSPSEYAINLHMLLGYVLKYLFTICNKVNWVTVVFLLSNMLSVLVLDMVFVEEKKDQISFWPSIIVLDLALFLVLSRFTFTVVAYWAGIAGLVGITYISIKGKECKHRVTIGVFAGIAFVFCLLIRAEVIKSLLIVYMVCIIAALLSKKNWTPLFIAVAAVCLMSLSIKSHSIISDLNPVQKEFLSWGETRSAALDCAAVPYDEAKFAEYGITNNQYTAIYNSFNYDFDNIDTDVMEALIELNHPLNKYDFDIMGMLETHFSIWTNLKQLLSYRSVYRIIFASVCLFYLCVGSRKDAFFVLLTWCCTLAAEFVFYFIRRAPYRVLMPTYLLAIVLILLCCNIDPQKESKLSMAGISLKKILMTLTILLACGSVIVYQHSGYTAWKYSETERAVLDYMAENNDKVFLAGDIEVYGIGRADSVWNHPGKRGIWNLIGNWETYSVPYFELMEKQGIQNPYDVLLEAVDNDKILLLTKLGDDFPASRSWILGLVEENYGIAVEFEKVEDISLTSHGDGVNYWVTYKLATKEVQ